MATYRSTAWMEEALCAAEWGFTDWPPELQERLCRDCPVRTECLHLGVQQGGRADRGDLVPFAGLSDAAMTRATKHYRNRRAS